MPSWFTNRIFTIINIFFEFIIFYRIIFIASNQVDISLIKFLFILFSLYSSWTFLSYISGKYSLINNQNSKFIPRYLLIVTKTFFLYILLLFLLIVFSNINGNYFPIIYFFKYSWFGLMLFLLKDFILLKYLTYRSKLVKKFLYVGSIEEYEIIKKLLGSKFINISISNKQSLEGLNNNFIASFNGLVLNTMKKDSYEKLRIIELTSYGCKVFSVTRFAEDVLQIILPDFLTIEDIMSSRFNIYWDNISFKIKRVGDILISFFLIILTIPIVLIASILIFLEDKGPIFYYQKRTGLNFKSFNVWKLRTMKVNAEKFGVQWSQVNDKRITKIGKILRLTRIDELPQLALVFLGKMSLIGPRPERPEIDKELIKSIPNYKLRYLVRPGLSGWAQVNFPYGSSLDDAKSKLSYDLFYISSKSILLDLLIFFKTIKLVINAKGR